MYRNCCVHMDRRRYTRTHTCTRLCAHLMHTQTNPPLHRPARTHMHTHAHHAHESANNLSPEHRYLQCANVGDSTAFLHRKDGTLMLSQGASPSYMPLPLSFAWLSLSLYF